MSMGPLLGAAAAGLCAGAVNGFFGSGGGMVLIPLLEIFCTLPEREIFSTSLAIMLPICLVSLILTKGPLPLAAALPYLLGSAAGGLLAAGPGKKIPVLWLHRLLGVLILLGGGRLLWS